MRDFIDIAHAAASTPEILRFALKVSAVVGLILNLIK